MAKKQPTTKRTKAKAKPSKPTKPAEAEGGGGRDEGNRAASDTDSGAEKNSAMDEADEYHMLFQETLKQAAEASERDRALMRATGYTDEEISVDDESRQKCELQEAEKEASDRLMFNRVQRGEVLGDRPGDIVRAVMYRVYTLLNDESTRSEGEGYLADVLAQIISVQKVNPKTVPPWIAKHLGSESFQFHWSYERRKTSRGLNRVLFTFCVRKIATLDGIVENLLLESGVLHAANGDALIVAVETFVNSIKRWEDSPGMLDVLKAVINGHLEDWGPSSPDFNVFFGSKWRQWKYRLPLECAELVLPFLVEEWAAYEAANHVEIARLKETNKLPSRLAPSDLRREFAKCAKAIFLENKRYDEVTIPEGKQNHFIRKFT